MMWASILILVVGVCPVIYTLYCVYDHCRDLVREEAPTRGNAEYEYDWPKTGKAFSSGLCECHTDCCSTWAVTCCQPMVLGQLTLRHVIPPKYRKSTCLLFAALLWAFIAWYFWTQYYLAGALWQCVGRFWVCVPNAPPFAAYLGESYYVPDHPEYMDEHEFWVLWGAVGLLAAILTCLVRKSIRARDEIPSSYGGPGWLEDACCSYFCGCCVLMQIMRHEGLVGGGRYKLCTPDGRREML